ncbi:hypothetical protein U1Q18_043447 [Sarracenia purpurea var. burkii]
MDYRRKRKLSFTPSTPYQLAKRFTRARQNVMTPKRRIQFLFNRPTAQGERHTHVFKTWSLHIKGGFHIASNPQSLGKLVFVDFLLVLDRTPNGATMPLYESIFPALVTPSTDQDCGLNSFMRPEAMSRFKLIRRVRIELSTFRTYGNGANRKSFELYLRFRESKSIYSQMRDENGSVHGMYSNCKKNAFLMYAIMHCDNRITVDGHINVTRIFYH